ncbi:MAG TPA: hypothetical protein VNE39_04450 [Planctomycetota bacterium]|nr:hypothetical protein [Planctomycetota bacterium]
MARGRERTLAAAVVLLLWPTCVLAQERGEGERPRGREPVRGREPLTAEQIAERQKQMKAGLERQAEFASTAAKGFEARRDELKAMAGKDTLPATPPPPQLFGTQGVRGGQNWAMRAAISRRGGDPRGGQPGREAATPPGTFEVANTDELKQAIAKAVDAYSAALPLFDEQKKAIEALLKQAEAGGDQDPAAARGRMAASQELMTKVLKAQTGAGDAEAGVQLLLAKAWLGVAKDKVAGDEAKAGAAKALEALDKYLALKAQLDDLAQKIDEQTAALQEGLGKVLPALAPPRGGRDGRGRPGDGGGRREERPRPPNRGGL